MIIDVAMMYLLQSVVHCVLPGPHTSNRRQKIQSSFMLCRWITVVFVFYNRVCFYLVVVLRRLSLSMVFPVRSRVEFSSGSSLISVT